ncbi:Beta-xylosidase [Lacunisphaera limnophila]|uniref:Beta-xylosidase n=1 Tax=Lacunisphaera limnophila TaxID=1838286 RepID=A0A1D8ATL2_9BACT|nr:glycoside hydrolase 43 family protein [Lacunisphaera limnophila]AOS44245.1 Beta-xylosidase [Lacunisphaera limnophila]
MRPRLPRLAALLLLAATPVLAAAPRAVSWTADNGNGTYTNPLFYDEFSDPDLIRVGEDFYLAGTTMHAMPGLVVLHSKDLVNWKFLSYAFDRLELGPDFNLENGKEAYGQGIWAPCIRYHNGKFYLFSNVNGHSLQVFTADNPAGPWAHRSIQTGIHDLSVLFDDDGRIYAVYGYDEVKVIEFKPDLSGFIAGSERVVIPRGNAMGEGHHFYKIKGQYHILSANYAPTGRMQAARADHVHGPYETRVIAAKETLGTQRGWSLNPIGLGMKVPEPGATFQLSAPGGNQHAAVPMHQGGIVDLPNGDWWGFSMLDFRSVGRTTALSPVTWVDGWPYFGLPGNLGRSPRTWTKPAVAAKVEPHAPYERSDDFAGPKLLPVWQWNHNPVNAKWSLTENPGSLRLHTLPATQLLWAKNTLTQRAIGPVSVVTAELDASGLQPGDTAGLALVNMPFATLGVASTDAGFVLRHYDQFKNQTLDQPLPAPRVWLRATADLDEDVARLSYSTDGRTFTDIGGEIRLPYQLKTFQGTRLGLFAFNTAGREGGHADFAGFRVEEPLADRTPNLPLGKVITFTNLANGSVVWANPHGMLHSAAPGSKPASSPQARFRVHDRGQGRVALEVMDGSGFLTVVGAGLSADVRPLKQESAASLFMWQDLLRDRQCMLLSLHTNRFVGLAPDTGEPYGADWPGTTPNRRDGTVLTWAEVAAE